MFIKNVLNTLVLAVAVHGLAVQNKYHSLPITIKRDNSESGLEKTTTGYVGVWLTAGSQRAEELVIFDTGSYTFFLKWYDYKASTTLIDTGESFTQAWFNIGTGEIINDYIQISDGPRVNFTYFVSTDKEQPTGVFGAHFLENQFGPGYITALKEEGLIDRKAFSLWFDYDAVNVGQGQVTFGGYDQAKFQGPLVKNNLTTPEEGSWNIVTGGIRTPNGEVYYENEPATLDSGNQNIVLQEDVLKSIQSSLPGSTWDGNQISYPDCNLDDDQKLIFHFGDANIEVLLRNICYINGNKGVLLFAVSPDPSINVFGASFITNAFTIFDIEDKTVSVANRRYTTETDIHQF